MNALKIGNKIYLLRMQAKMNQTEFAHKIGISQSTLSSYEKGNSMPSLDVLIAIATNFHVSTDWLLDLSTSEMSISSVSDIANFFFQLNDLQEVRYELEINNHLPNDLETEDNRWYCSLKFFGHSEGHPCNMEICQILSRLEEYRSSFESYFISKEMYDWWKEQQLEYYANSPVTQKKYPMLDTVTRLRLRNELMEKQFKNPT